MDYVLYTENQYCRAYVSEPYSPARDHSFDYGRVLREIGVPKSEFAGAGSMRLFDRKLMYDYSRPLFCDNVVKEAVAKALRAIKQKS